MILLKKTAELCKWLESQRKAGKRIGFVPTMGALHSGHISLIESSKRVNEVTVTSIFINPTQFNDSKDFEKYPITIEKDIDMLEQAACDVLFLPSVKEIYPDGVKQQTHYDLGYLENILEGKFRPGHFQGVCMVVHRLIDVVKPDNFYVGQKDYQQCMVIKKLVELTKQQDKIKIHICPTLREADGLAMSSRNIRLSEKERTLATTIYQGLRYLKDNLNPENIQIIKNHAKRFLENAGFKVDYVEIADAASLELMNEWDGKRKLVALIAAFLNEVRLIDNMLLSPSGT